MAKDLQTEAEVFARRYASLFSLPDCSSPEHVADVARKVGQHYRPGFTFFRNGNISKFESQDEAAQLIEREMRKNIGYGIGTHLELVRISKVELYSDTSALFWLDWTFHPAGGSEFEGKGWSFTNVYGYRADTEGQSAGWEFVIRDQEVDSMRKATGKSFSD